VPDGIEIDRRGASWRDIEPEYGQAIAMDESYLLAKQTMKASRPE
jgi:hypothetical protein